MTTHFRLERDQWSCDWLAYQEGKSSPVINPDTGRRWCWPTMERAAGDLTRLLGTGVAVFRYLSDDGEWKRWP